jgi:hypothetical protein
MQQLARCLASIGGRRLVAASSCSMPPQHAAAEAVQQQWQRVATAGPLLLQHHHLSHSWASRVGGRSSSLCCPNQQQLALQQQLHHSTAAAAAAAWRVHSTRGLQTAADRARARHKRSIADGGLYLVRRIWGGGGGAWLAGLSGEQNQACPARHTTVELAADAPPLTPRHHHHHTPPHQQPGCRRAGHDRIILRVCAAVPGLLPGVCAAGLTRHTCATRQHACSAPAVSGTTFTPPHPYTHHADVKHIALRQATGYGGTVSQTHNIEAKLKAREAAPNPELEAKAKQREVRVMSDEASVWGGQKVTHMSW